MTQLYGREEQLGVLFETFDRIVSGESSTATAKAAATPTPEVVPCNRDEAPRILTLITGHSGTGKHEGRAQRQFNYSFYVFGAFVFM